MPGRRKAPESNGPDWKASGLPYLDLKPGEIDKHLLSAASLLARKLNLGSLSTSHLAVALALPSSRYKGSFTNSRYKLLGDALEVLAFALFTFQQLPTRMFATKNISQFTAIITSHKYHRRLFDHLDLESLVRRDQDNLISEQTMTDAVKAIAAAIYLSFRDFQRFFVFITDNLGPWCRDIVTFLAGNPLAFDDPKTLLQELIQEQKIYRTEYSGNIQTGPDHMPSFSTTLVLKNENNTVQTIRGVGNSLKAAQQAAALSTLKTLLPTSDGRTVSAVASRFWKNQLDRLLGGKPGTIVGVCGVDHFRLLNSFAAYLELKSFSNSFPNLSPYLEKPAFIDIMMGSIGRLSTAFSSEALKVGKRGIKLITSKSPDDIYGFTSPDVELWLANFRQASASLKLPTNPVDFPLSMVPLSDLRGVREWNISISGDDTCLISEPMLSHVLTLLELLEDDGLASRRNISITADVGRDWRSLKLSLDKDWGRVHLEQLVERLSINAFFSGVHDTISGGSTTFTVDVKGVFFEACHPHTRVFVDILKRFYRMQDHLRSLYRIVHDLKNQIIAIRNYALRAKEDPQSKYRMFIAIEELQSEIREREVALGVYFRAVDISTLSGVNLQQLVRDFMIKQIPLLPEHIRPRFAENLESTLVLASKELMISLLTNLTQNAIEAMPGGGQLSLSVSYNETDSMLEIDVADTGVGIAHDALPDLFTSLRSTKKKGMGLGLATVKTIVEQHDGLIDVQSQLGTGTTFTILLPLKKASDAPVCEH